jgi:Laminin G domain
MGLSRGAAFAFRRSGLLIAALLVAGASVVVASASAAKIAVWEMNERPGARTMHDSSGSDIDGRIGSAVVTGVVTGGATGYRWTGQEDDGYHPERLVTVKSSRLNPGTGDFAVIVRLLTGAGDQNIVQKGQSHTSGGMFKIDMVEGHVICMYRGSQGRSAVRSGQTVWDHAWHTIRCERRGSHVLLTVDGGTPRMNSGATGRIANSWELSLGGKLRCNGARVQCDYFVGRLDRVVVKRLR